MFLRVSLILMLLVGKNELIAERLRASCELYAFGYGTETVAWLSEGAEIWPNGEAAGGRLPVKIRCWVNRKYIRKNRAQPQAQLSQNVLSHAATLYAEHSVRSDTLRGETFYYVDLFGFIPADRVDPHSVIELALSKLLIQEGGRLNAENMLGFMDYFGLSLADSGQHQFQMVEYLENKQPRLRLIFIGIDLVAIVPDRKMSYTDFIAEVNHSGRKLIYLKKLKAEEERLLSEWLTKRLD